MSYNLTVTSGCNTTIIVSPDRGPVGNTGPAAPLRLAPFVGDKPGPQEEIWRFVAPENYTIVASKCKGNAGINASANAVFTLYNNGSQIGTYTFIASSENANISISNTTVLEDDVLTLVAPLDVDLTLADIALVLYGTVNT